MSELMDRWNKAWEGWTLTLSPTPKHFKRRALEGETAKDKDLVRRAMMGDFIHTEEQYDDLCRIVGEWGYCVSIPMDWRFT